MAQINESISSSSTIRQFDHFIPVSSSRLIDVLQRSGLDPAQLEVIHKLRAIISHQFYQQLLQLKQLYQPYNPDRELLIEEDTTTEAGACIQSLREILIAANYSELDQQQIEYALQKTSPYGLEIHIDFAAFAHVALFYRGKSQDQLEIRDWKTLYLKKKTISLMRYQRLCLLLQYKDPRQKPGIHLKLFRDILRPDMEMLFPECTIRMKALDKIKLAITGGGGTAGGLFATISKISAAVSSWTIVIAMAGFAMLLWRQISKILVQKTRYMATLAQNLYFHNLDNNAGAIAYLIDLAREEEIKEIILAYALLNLRDIKSQEQLDSACEDWFEQHFAQHIDFDVSDAVDKLRRFQVLKNKQGLLCEDAAVLNSQLNQHWLSFIQIESPDQMSVIHPRSSLSK